MNKEEIATFAYKIASHNERIIVTLFNEKEYTGYFFNNTKIAIKSDNNWEFVIPGHGETAPIHLVLNGDDIASIKKVRLF